MKKYFFFLLAILTFNSCSSNSSDVFLFSFFKDNGQDGLHLAYSLDGLNWKALKNNESFLSPEVGNDKLMRDPCIIKGPDNKFHMVWTVSWHEKGIGYANSDDLINWSKQKFIPVMEHEENASNCWAPELFYDDVQKQYMIYWSTYIPGKYPKTDSLGDNGMSHRIYYTLTDDFADFSETKILYNKGFNVIDATIHKIDSKYVMFIKNETLLPNPEKNIRIATSDKLNENYSEASEPLTISWVEGPTAIQNNNEWILYYDMYMKGQFGAIKSTDLKEWTDISDKISFPEGTRHGTVLKVKQSILDVLLKEK